MAAELIAKGVSDECGCPEETWNINGIDVLIHLEPDGRGEICLDAGDWQDDKMVSCCGIDDLRQQTFIWVCGLPCENDVTPPAEGDAYV